MNVRRSHSRAVPSLYTCLQILSVSVFEKAPLLSAFQTDGAQIEPTDDSRQLFLFEF